MQTQWLFKEQMLSLIHEHKPIHFWQLQLKYDFEASYL